MNGIENIGKRDIAWSYAATIFMIGGWVILLPFILNKFSSETVGIWNIFQTVSMLVMILDFGFRPTFARNLSYVFSGVRHLQKYGVEHMSESSEVDYSLLKGTLTAMRRFYRWMALGALGLLGTLGTVYFLYLIRKYSGDRQDAIIAWLLLIAISCYNLYTLYYDALLLGKGYVRRSQQIMVIGQIVYIGVAIGLVYAGCGLKAVVSAQLLSLVIRRVMMHRVFFTPQMRQALHDVQEQDAKQILNAIMPNAVKIGLTQLGGFCVTKSAVFMGSAFLSLEQVGCYGITVQVMDVLSRCATIYYQSVTPKLAQYRAQNNISALRQHYLYNVMIVFGTFVLGGVGWVFLGDWVLSIIHSKTFFLPTTMLIVMLVINWLEQNHASSAGFIMADNRIPFFIPSLVSGAATIGLMWLFMAVLDWGIWGMILAPGIAQLAYQNWKWPYVIIRELRAHTQPNHHQQ